MRDEGFTLVELMIALLIGLFLLGGLLTLVSGMKRTHVAQNGLAQLQENERLAMSIVTHVVESAGYYPNPKGQSSDAQFPPANAYAPTTVFAASSQVIFGTGAFNAALPNTLSVRYATAGDTAPPPPPGPPPPGPAPAAINDGVLDCAGRPNHNPLTFQTTLSIDLPSSDLVCTVNGTAIHLVTGIKNMQILYGVQTNLALANASVDRYVDANHVPNWNNVISVKVTLTLANPLAGQPGQPPTLGMRRVIKLLNKPSFIA